MNQTAAQELDELNQLIGRLELGELDRAEFRKHSVHYGVYTQRQTDAYFVRLRVPLGMVSVPQLKTLAGALHVWGNGECHLTARQGVEVHGLKLGEILPVLRCLADTDLFSHETGGNSVRGIMVCPHAGVARYEPFDVTPYAHLLTQCFWRHPDFQTLPRKLKIGFSCCADDCARTAIQDLGFQARLGPDGEHGFRVLAGGGTGALPRLAEELMEFLPAAQLAIFTEAFLRTFNRLGDRTNRHRARVKFLIQRIGLGVFSQEIQKELELLRQQGRSYPAVIPFLDGPQASAADPNELAGPAGDKCVEPEAVRNWITHRTEPQQHPGFSTVTIGLPGGRVTSAHLVGLAKIVERFNLEIRLTPEQSFLLRWAPTDRLAELHGALNEAEFSDGPGVPRLVACPGSSTCSNGFTHTAGLVQALQTRLAALPGLGSQLNQLSIRLSGCGNGCGLHAIADLGLEGLANRTGNVWFPMYRIWLGGRESESSPRIGDDLGAIQARDVPACVADLVTHYIQNRDAGESLAGLIERVGSAGFLDVVSRYKAESEKKTKAFAVDWGETEAYRPRNAKPTGIC